MNDQDKSELAGYIAEKYYDDPVGYCKDILCYVPDEWQGNVLSSVNKHRRTAVRSGHGVGKTRLAASSIHWFMATRSYPRIRATANTEKQIMSVLWAELATVNRAARNRELFDYQKTSFRLMDAPETHFAEAIAWSKEKSEAFAGIHAKNVLYVYDEASAIDDLIWEVSQGAMTEEGGRWLALGNPTRNNGKFNDCFGINAWQESDVDTSKWHSYTISCYDSPRVSEEYINEIVREYGKGSDPFRVRVLGLPPLQESQQFISLELFDKSLHNMGGFAEHNPKILGIDVARFGDDNSVGWERRGNSTRRIFKLNGQDTMKITGQVLHAINEAKKEPYDVICIDDVGVGGGVVDRLREQGISVVGVNAGMASRRKDCKNMRAELWKTGKEWMEKGKVEEELRNDLTGIQYYYDSGDRLVMERKVDMKKRGLASPDDADAFLLTFYPQNAISKKKRIQRKPKPSPIRRSGIR